MINSKLIWSLFSLILLSFMSYLIPSTFLPSIAQQKNLSLGSIGIIISVFPIGAILVSFNLGKHMEKIGKKRIIYNGGLLLAGSMLMFAFSIILGNKALFFIVSCVARFLQGAAVSALSKFIILCLKLQIFREILIFSILLIIMNNSNGLLWNDTYLLSR